MIKICDLGSAMTIRELVETPPSTYLVARLYRLTFRGFGFYASEDSVCASGHQNCCWVLESAVHALMFGRQGLRFVKC
jgi:hypothetical protein